MKKLFLMSVVCMTAWAVAFSAPKKTDAQYIADLDSSKEESVIKDAAHYVGKEKMKEAVPNLVKLLSDQRQNVRLYSAIALGYIGDEKAVDALNKTLLEDQSSDVRYAALLATVRIGSQKSLDTWIKAKQTEKDPIILDFLTKMEERAKKK